MSIKMNTTLKKHLCLRTQQPANGSRTFRCLFLLAAVLFGGTWIGCRSEDSYWEAKPSDDKAAESPSATSSSPSSAAVGLEDGEKIQVDWLVDYDQALANAKELDRPVLIDFAATWCAPCVMMDKHIWPDPAVQDALYSKVVPLRIDLDSKSAAPLVEKYRIEFVPTILLVDADGQELKREGFIDVEQVTEMIKSVKKHEHLALVRIVCDCFQWPCCTVQRTS